MRGKLQDDPDAYREIAENLLKHGEFAVSLYYCFDGTQTTQAEREQLPKFRPTAYRPPLYPIVLSNLPTANGQSISQVKIALLQLVLGIVTVWLTWLAAKRVFEGTILGPVIASLLVACDPILLNQQSLVMTETLATFLATVALWRLIRFDASQSWFEAGLAGGTIGLAVLCRPTFFPWVGFVSIEIMLGRSCQRSDRTFPKAIGLRFGNLFALLMAATAVIAPWGIRNYRLLGKPVVTTTHGGYTFALGNNPSFYDYLLTDSSGLPFTADKMEMALAVDPALPIEIALDEAYYEEAWNAVKASPVGFGLACGYRIVQLWSPLPHRLTADEPASRRWLRYATAAWYCGVYGLVAISAWRLRWRLLDPPWIWGLLLCLAFTAVHTFYWTNLRMRAPLMPFIALVAAASLYSFKGNNSTLRNSIG